MTRKPKPDHIDAERAPYLRTTGPGPPERRLHGVARSELRTAPAAGEDPPSRTPAETKSSTGGASRTRQAPGWSAPGTCSWATAQARSRRLGGGQRGEAGVRLVWHRAVEAGVRAWVRDALVAECRAGGEGRPIARMHRQRQAAAGPRRRRRGGGPEGSNACAIEQSSISAPRRRRFAGGKDPTADARPTLLTAGRKRRRCSGARPSWASRRGRRVGCLQAAGVGATVAERLRKSRLAMAGERGV